MVNINHSEIFYEFVEITKIFYMADEFCKIYDKLKYKFALSMLEKAVQ